MYAVCLITQSRPTLCDPLDCSPQSSSVHGIFQARILECVAMPSSRGSFQTRDWTCLLHCRWILYLLNYQGSPYRYLFSSVQFSLSVVSNSLQPHCPCPSPTLGACSNSCPSSRWCHPTILSSVICSYLQSFPVSGSFPMSQVFTSGGRSIGVSASASVLPTNVQDWFPLGLIGWISLLSKGLSRILSNTTVQKHSRDCEESSPTPHCKSINSLALNFLYGLYVNSHIHRWLVDKP